MKKESKNYKRAEEMITNIKSHVSNVFVFVEGDGTNSGCFIEENCGIFHPVRLLFHFNPFHVPSDKEEEYIREVVYIDARKVDGYNEAVKELCNRITPVFNNWLGRSTNMGTITDVFRAVEEMACHIVQAI